MYTPIASDAESPRASGYGVYVKAGVALGLACALVFAFVHSGGISDEATSLIGLRAAPYSMTARTNDAAGLRTLASIPGPSPWKELALLGLQKANRCGRDMSMQALTKNTPVPKEEDAAFFDAVKKVSAAGPVQAVVNYGEKITAGVTEPMGYFDPLGFSANVSPGKVAFFREVELKHGRVCMWASIGYIYGELFHPFFGGGFNQMSYKLVNVPEMKTFWLLLAVAIAIPELNWSIPAVKKGTGIFGGEMKEGRTPGDFGFDPLNLKETFDQKEMADKELNNGRLAMLAVTGMFAQELATGKTLLSGLTGSDILDAEATLQGFVG